MPSSDGSCVPVTKQTSSFPKTNLSQVWVALFLALVAVVVVGVRIRLLNFPLERDEGEYAYAGQLLLEGIPPYQLACNMKMPGIYVAYAALMAVFGQSPAGIHSGLLLVHLATLAVLFVLARHFFNPAGAAVAVGAYAWMIMDPSYLGLAAHATHFVILPALLGALLLWRLKEDAGLRGCLACGLCFGAAFLMKQPGMFFGFFGGLYLAWAGLSRRTPGRKIALSLVAYSFGCLLPFAVVCLWLKWVGVFPQFWFWTVTYAWEYARSLPLETGIRCAVDGFALIIGSAPMVWLVAGAGLGCLLFTRMERGARVFLCGFLVFAFLAVCPGMYFRNHYFILLAPALALLAGLAVSWGGTRLAGFSKSPWLCHIPLLVAALACAQSLYSGRAVLFSLPPGEACRAVYGWNPFPESQEIADYIRQNTRSDQRIVVFGSEPQIYFYARRHSSTGQIYAYPLMEPQPFALKMQEDMIREIGENPPEFLVFVAIQASWLVRPESNRLLFEWCDNYTKKNMRLVGLYHFNGGDVSDTVRGPAAAFLRLPSRHFIAIYQNRHTRENDTLPRMD